MNHRYIKVYVNMWRILPFYIICKHKVGLDIAMWKRKNKELNEYSELFQFGYFAMNMIEFRNVMLNRLHRNKIGYVISRMLFKPLESLYINMPPGKLEGDYIFYMDFQQL